MSPSTSFETTTAFSFIIGITSILSYLNYRYLRLPTTIGITLIAMILSIAIMIIDFFTPGAVEYGRSLLQYVSEEFIEAVISLLLFGGALHLDRIDLSRHRLAILTLAIGGTLVTTFVVGTFAFFGLKILGIGISYSVCLSFGALVSPTDPVAIIGILEKARVPGALQTLLVGESLVNDGFAVALSFLFLAIWSSGDESAWIHVGAFARSLAGAVISGAAIGWMARRALRSVKDSQMELLITLGAIASSFAVAATAHFTEPLTAVSCGLVLGRQPLSRQTHEFWDLIDSILNAFLFVSIGFAFFQLDVDPRDIEAGLLAIVAVIVARWAHVEVTSKIFGLKSELGPKAPRLLTWAGLKGGTTLALALWLPHELPRDTLFCMTYGVIGFSVLVQGLTISRLIPQVKASDISLQTPRKPSPSEV